MASITNIAPNRAVAVLTPLVFAPLAGAISVAAAELAPGMQVDETSLTAIFIAGATIAFGKAAQWTKGWQAFERADASALNAPAGVELVDDDELADDDLDLLADGEELADDDPDLLADEDLDLDLDGDLDLDEDDDLDESELMALLPAHKD